MRAIYSSQDGAPIPRGLPSAPSLLTLVGMSELDALVPPERRRRIATLARGFPVAPQSACYEVWLGESRNRVDLALCLFPGFDAEPEPRSALEDLARDPAFLPCLRFLRAWESPGTGLWPRFPFLWVAFDLDEERPRLTVPSLGVCADPDFWGAQGAPPAGLADSADLCCRAVHGCALSGEIRRVVEGTERLFAPDVRPRHFSFMFSRTPASFKLDVALPSDRIAEYLEFVGWPKSARAAENALRKLMPAEERVQLNLVLEPRPVEPLEIECLTRSSAPSVTRRIDALAALVDEGLVAPRKARALLGLCHAPVVETSVGYDVARSWYLKVRFNEGVASEVKAYVGMTTRIGRTARSGTQTAS